ncbi:MAG TPA: hypothetical protein VMF89_14155 [Polyangiales bacterium]|nr:hypothetical protein [Polyangiales bacterium]
MLGSRSALRRVLWGLALLAYTLLFGEAYVRIFAPQPVMPRYVTGTPWGMRGNIPHAHYWHHTPEVDVEYRINGEGMRADRDFAIRKPAGTCRIALFGDSLLMGYELDLRDTFASRLEHTLRAQGYRVEVLNFSVSGFGTAEMLRTYEAYARQFDPDIVMFSWHTTDADDNVRSQLYRLRDGKLEVANSAYLPGIATQDMLMKSRIYRFVADHSELYSLLREQSGVFMKRFLAQLLKQRAVTHDADASDGLDAIDEDDPRHRANAQLSSAIVAHAADVVQGDGKEFYMLEIPIRVSRTQFRSSIALLDDRVRARVHIISPLGAFERVARPDLKLYYEQGEGHFTPAGAQLLVDAADAALTGSTHLAACKVPPASGEARTAAR